MAHSGARKGLSHNVRAQLAGVDPLIEEEREKIRQLNKQLEQEGYDLARQLEISQDQMNRQMAAMDNWTRNWTYESGIGAIPLGRPEPEPEPEPEKPFPTHHEDGKRIGWLAELGAEYERVWG